MVELYSERFILKELNECDATPLYLSWLKSKQSSQYITYKQKSIQELKGYITSQKHDENVLFFGVFVKDSNRHIGNVKFIFKDVSKETINMGIMIGDVDWHGKGVAGEVLNLFSDYAVSTYNSIRMTLGVKESNIFAIKAYEKIGFQMEGEIPELPGYSMVWTF